MKLYLAAALSAALVGCASSGPKIDAAGLNEVRKGQTTVADIVSRFGRPSILSKNMDGTQTAAYMQPEGKSDPAAVVPLIGALAGNTDANVDSVIFYFDSKGILSDYKTTQTNPGKPATATTSPDKPATANTSQPASTNPNKENTGKAARSDSDKATQSTTSKAAQKDNPASPADSNTWTIRSWQPSGYKENR